MRKLHVVLAGALFALVAGITMLGAEPGMGGGRDSVIMGEAGKLMKLERVHVLRVEREGASVKAVIKSDAAALRTLRNLSSLGKATFEENGEELVLHHVTQVNFEAPDYDEAVIRGKVYESRSTLRSVATALESYWIDCNEYPMWVLGSSPQSVAGGAEDLKSLPTFARRVEGGGLLMLTTPIAYLGSRTVDPFGGKGNLDFSYYTHNPANDWILVARGPDGDFDLDASKHYRGESEPDAAKVLAPFTYDPSNGTMSSGDIWRVKQ